MHNLFEFMTGLHRAPSRVLNNNFILLYNRCDGAFYDVPHDFSRQLLLLWGERSLASDSFPARR